MNKEKIILNVWKILIQDFISGIIDNDIFFAIGEDLHKVKKNIPAKIEPG